MKTKIIIAVVVIAVAAASFFGGVKYAQSKSRAGFTRGPGAQMQFGGQAGANSLGGKRAGGFSGGEIISFDGKILTLKLQNGGSQLVLLGSSTAIMKSTTGSASDLTSGTNVMVTGTTNSDGSLTASSVSIRPAR